MAVCVAVLLVASTTSALPMPDTAGMDAALERLDIPEALRRYDEATAESGPSLELLHRVARADLDVSSVETESMIKLIREGSHLTESQAVLVVTMAKTQALALGGTKTLPELFAAAGIEFDLSAKTLQALVDDVMAKIRLPAAKPNSGIS